jgi:hypothetical protein
MAPGKKKRTNVEMDEYFPIPQASVTHLPTTSQSHHTEYEPAKRSVQSFLNVPFRPTSTAVQPSSTAVMPDMANMPDWMCMEDDDDATQEYQDCELEALGLGLVDEVHNHKRRRMQAVSLLFSYHH